MKHQLTFHHEEINDSDVLLELIKGYKHQLCYHAAAQIWSLIINIFDTKF